MLYRAEAFEPLTRQRWNDERIRDGIREIGLDTDASFRGHSRFWRADDWDRWQGTSPMKNLYVGTAGVLWALDELRRRGHVDTSLDLGARARRNVELFRERPDLMPIKLPEPKESSLLCGETGVLLVALRIAPNRSLADALYERICANVANEADELMWGTPGTLLAARLMHEWTRKTRWRDAARESAVALWSRRGDDGLWTQRLYRQELKSLTPPHGLVGNVQVLRPHLDARRRRLLERESAAILARTAVIEGGLANWPPRDRPTLPGPDGQIRVQWCAGAPGVVIAAADYLDEELLLAGARLVWRAGPPNLEQRLLDLSRHRRQRLRAARDVRSYGRRALAAEGAEVRRARPGSGPAGTYCARPRPSLALHGRPRRRALPRRVSRREGRIPRPGRMSHL